jgi:hypothetical protein
MTCYLSGGRVRGHSTLATYERPIGLQIPGEPKRGPENATGRYQDRRPGDLSCGNRRT